MNTTSFRKRRYSNLALWAAALLCLNVACFHTLDPAKVKCNSKSTCPSPYSCSMDQGTYGHCVLGPVNLDGGNADQYVSPGSDGKAGSDGIGLDGIASTGGAGGSPLDGSRGSGGAGGVSGPTDGSTSGGEGGSLGGSGGVSLPDGPSATGGATGGTTSTPDAPVLNDAPDAPATLPNGSPCTLGSQCSNGLCVDGHCCDSKCDGNCESCATGACSFSATPRKACGGAGKCAGICDKSNTNVCTFDSTTVCATQSCSGGVRTNKSTCDGQGSCPTQTTTNCTGNQCMADGSDCATCTDEPTATTCAGGHCGPTANNCGHTVQCSTTCSGTAQTCGGGGVSGMCGCTPVSTSQTCGSHCGTLTNNCGLSVDCGGCTSPNTCGGGGTANVCGCTDSSACTGHCGTLTDKCGQSVQCSTTCTGTGQTCGGGGTAPLRNAYLQVRAVRAVFDDLHGHRANMRRRRNGKCLRMHSQLYREMQWFRWMRRYLPQQLQQLPVLQRWYLQWQTRQRRHMLGCQLVYEQ